MKKFIFTSKMLSMLLILAMTFSTISCNEDEDEDIKPTETITTIVLSTENLSIFAQAVIRADLANTFDDENVNLTVFAPTDEAFAAFLAAEDYEEGIYDVDINPEILRQILLNHVVSTETTVANLPTDGYLTTGGIPNAPENSSLSLYVNKSSSGTRLNDSANITNGDIRATNGIIHIVDGVIDLPTIATHLRINPSLSTSYSLLQRNEQPDFAAILSSAGPFTVFAPTNDAFSSLDRELPGGLAAVTPENITNILRYHVVEGKLLASQLSEGQILPTTLIPRTVTVTVNGGTKIIDESSRTNTIGITDIEATNGVIHTVDQVLLPNNNLQ